MKYAIPLALACCACGCHWLSETPVMKEARIDPAVLQPGASATIQVHVKDRFDIVRWVEATVKEEPDRSLRLRDDGEGGDEKAGDGTYTLKVDVPAEAPGGVFNVTVTAHRKDGQPVMVREQRKKTPLAASVTMTIDAPAAEVAVEAAPADAATVEAAPEIAPATPAEAAPGQ